MADSAKVSVVTIGGKGSSLSSSSVYAIANGLAQVRIDSSVLDRLASSSSPSQPSPLTRHQITLPGFLSPEESRASYVVVLNKLLHLAGSRGIRPLLPVRIAEALNSTLGTIGFDSLDLTAEEVQSLEALKLSSTLYGISAVLDHQSAALSTVADAVAALSCERSKADVAVFNSTDSGDGFAAKDEVGVASDLKVLLNGSKLVGHVESEEVSSIPKVHGCLRKQAKSVHSETRVDLNSAPKVGRGGPGGAAAAGAVQITLLPLAAALRNLGNSSLSRAKLNLETMGDDNSRSILAGLFDEECPSGDRLRNEFKLLSELVLEGEDNYDKFAHEVNVLLGMVWKIVAWEGITALRALWNLVEDDAELKGAEVNGGGNVRVEKKSEKKKKKVVLGRGNSVVIQEIKKRLPSKVGEANEGLESIHKWVEDFLSFLEPKDLRFESLLNKIKEIVESNESRRLPKLPKVMKFL